MRIDRSFERLYESEYRTVYRTVYLMSRNRALAEDATQEAFVRALERWGRLRNESWAGGWVTTTALNLARRSLRQRLLRPSGQAAVRGFEEVSELWTEVSRLPLRQRQALVLRYRVGLPVHEVASAMGLAESTVRVHLARARATLSVRMRADPH